MPHSDELASPASEKNGASLHLNLVKGSRQKRGVTPSGPVCCVLHPRLMPNRNVGKATWFYGSSLLVSWLCGRPWPLALLSGCCRVARSCLVLLAVLRCLVLSFRSVSFRFLKSGHDPGHRPKDRSSGRYPQVRTIYLDVGPAIGYLLLLQYRYPSRLSALPTDVRQCPRATQRCLKRRIKFIIAEANAR